MTRIIAGQAGGRRLAVPGGMSTRPTSDRAREGLFGSVLSELGSLAGTRVLDLYAGSGAVGLEALSRGASQVLLVESDARAVAVIKANVASVAMPGARVLADKVERLLARPAEHGEYDLVFADPPYALAGPAVTRMLVLLARGWLAPDALVVVERATRSGGVDWPAGLVPGKSRAYGEATFWYGHRPGPSKAMVTVTTRDNSRGSDSVRGSGGAGGARGGDGARDGDGPATTRE